MSRTLVAEKLRGSTKLITEEEEVRPVYDKRKCLCGNKLSMYNKDTLCHSCIVKGRSNISNLSEDLIKSSDRRRQEYLRKKERENTRRQERWN